MKRFVFRLARLERLRDIRRREARARLAQALAEVRLRETERLTAERGVERSLEAAPAAGLGNDALAWRQLAAWREDLQRLARHARRGEQLAIEVGEAAAAGHLEADRAYRALERLREKRFRRWRLEADREEQKLLDEAHLLQRPRRED